MKLDKNTNQKIWKHIIRKLVRRQAFGKNVYIKKHDLRDGIPGHYHGSIDSILDDMWKKRIIMYHKGKTCVSLIISEKEARTMLAN